MQKWVISWIDWFDHELKSDVVNVSSELKAYDKAVRALGFDPSDEELNSVEDYKHFAFNCDGMVNAIRID